MKTVEEVHESELYRRPVDFSKPYTQTDIRNFIGDLAKANGSTVDRRSDILISRVDGSYLISICHSYSNESITIGYFAIMYMIDLYNRYQSGSARFAYTCPGNNRQKARSEAWFQIKISDINMFMKFFK